jgi:large subunit ribosomal protein L4
MTSTIVRNWSGEEVGTTDFELKVAKEENAAHIVHRALTRQLNNERQGNASTKTRAEVRGGGRKPWRQKGTGRARAGSIRSPLWRGGGVSFGPKPRDFDIKMNRKERRLALRTALASRLDDLVVVETFVNQLAQGKTKELVEALKRWEIYPEHKALLILSEIPEAVERASRNICSLKVIKADGLNIHEILTAHKIITTVDSLTKIREVYGDD